MGGDIVFALIDLVDVGRLGVRNRAQPNHKRSVLIVVSVKDPFLPSTIFHLPSPYLIFGHGCHGQTSRAQGE